MLAGDKDGLDIFRARISRRRLAQLIVLMPCLDFEVEGSTLIGEVLNFDDALGELLLQVLEKAKGAQHAPCCGSSRARFSSQDCLDPRVACCVVVPLLIELVLS